MKRWLRGWRGGALAYLIIAGLVIGGLGWATHAALRLEQEQWQSRRKNQREDKIRLALWQLDGRVSALMAREESRPYHHYSIFYAPSLALGPQLHPHVPGSVLQLSPLMNADLPDWMLLHFQIDPEQGWASPQVPDNNIVKQLKVTLNQPPLKNVTPERQTLLAHLSKKLPAAQVLETARERGGEIILKNETLGMVSCNIAPLVLENQGQQLQVDAQTINRFSTKRKVDRDVKQRQQAANPPVAFRAMPRNTRNTTTWVIPQFAEWGPGTSENVSFSSLAPVWVTTAQGSERLLMVRRAQVGNRFVCQGIVLDEKGLKSLLLAEIKGLFPTAKLVRARDDHFSDPVHTMAALPFELEPGPLAAGMTPPQWTPLHIGLLLAWIAAGIALLAVGLGGWSLMDLSERRFRFVSAVTHELRTPLTTLRLYLDMLTGGMIQGEEKKKEYLETLSSEAGRLNRLVTNVLDVSRLERQKARYEKTSLPISEILGRMEETWTSPCGEAGKTLIVENQLEADCTVETDREMVEQILGNLLDNACKYTREAEDGSLWLRASREKNKLILEVEDRGPGIPKRERRSIFRTFSRGRDADVTAGGIGLGLALAHRWARLLGGRLSLCGSKNQKGACFRLELPRPE